ncbi:MAG: phosphatidylserine decarboxylase [Candidatus Cloacimonadota bacterium]|nr:MAG: phosphatidylserine decarboxylase [Candidatus Cloacimonadota bacterium]PIE77599.1 MAG: phosphatidylserine decarboxylase [Candidatus Delongbacteria bacterium]
MEKIYYKERFTGKKILENPPGKGFINFIYNSSLGKLTLEAMVKRKVVSYLYGKYMDSKRSRKMIPDFIKKNNINIEEAKLAPDKYKTFNQFFYRNLKDKARKLGRGLISPADGKILVFNEIDDNRNFFIKGEEFTLSQFIGDDGLVKKYYKGSMAIIRLAPADYHRFHFPATGVVSKSKKIDGNYYSVSPLAMKKSLQFFLKNKREYSILESEKFGEILYSEIGATMVGSIIQTYKPDTKVEKGDEKGYFAFGGSSLLLLFEKDKVKFSEDLLKNTNEGFETKINMGETIGNSTIDNGIV